MIYGTAYLIYWKKIFASGHYQSNKRSYAPLKRIEIRFDADIRNQIPEALCQYTCIHFSTANEMVTLKLTAQIPSPFDPH